MTPSKKLENLQHFVLMLLPIWLLLPDKHNISYLNGISCASQTSLSLSPSLTKRLKIYCWQSFTISQGSSWCLTGYSALSTRLGLLNLVASFLMSSWVQEKDQTWALTDEHQIAHHSGWCSSFKPEIFLASPPSFRNRGNSLLFITKYFYRVQLLFSGKVLF